MNAVNPNTYSRPGFSKNDCVLSVNDLKVRFYTRDGIVRAINGVSFQLNRGETIGIVGESGCGKSVMSLAVMGLMLGFVQWQSGMEAWGLWGAWVGFPGLAVLWAVSATGQRLSAHQMEELRERIDALVEGMEAPGEEG